MSEQTPRPPEGEVRQRRTGFRAFSSFEGENAAEHRRLARMGPEERMREFAVLQARRWGESWETTPMERRATWERLTW